MRRRRMLGRVVLRGGLRRDMAWGRAAFVDNLVEPAVEPGQCFGDAVGRGLRHWDRRGCRGNRRARLRIRVRHAFELPRQRVETLIDGGEVLAAGVLVVVNLAG